VERSRDWLKEAQAELAAARDLFSGGHWSWCCFTAQQAAEKAIKALCEHYRSPQSGNNLNILLQSVAAQTVVEQRVLSAGARLNRYYIPARCPDAFPQGAPAEQFFDADAHSALADAEEISKFAEGIIGPP
jgi:HEPN domain-containing protein